MFDIIQFLAKQNLALRGHREDDTRTDRGNFLELVHLLEKYDPVLKMSQSSSFTYMSPQIQNKFIEILGNKVRQEVRVVESFIDIIETKNKTAEGISDMIISKLKAEGLDIMNCRGPEGILSMVEFNLDQALQDINKEEFQLERVRLQAFIAATERIRFGSLGLSLYK
ncbi:hypothetical protein TNCV_4665371 [Trichonephila clavipes]|nr:hypothetical protein TNCV_4665371 [Trichonephila clavipes]